MEEALNHAFRDLRICMGETARANKAIRHQKTLSRSILLLIIATTVYFTTEVKHLNERIEELEQKGD